MMVMMMMMTMLLPRMIIIIIIIIIVIIDRSTVADQLLQLVDHVFCAFGVERSRQTF